MNKSGIEEFSKNEIVFIKGQNLVNRNRVAVKVNPNDPNHFTGKVFDTENSYYLIDLTVKGNTVASYKCSCSLEKPCYHVVGVLIKIFIQPKVVKQSAHEIIIDDLNKKKKIRSRKNKKIIKEDDTTSIAPSDIDKIYEKLSWPSCTISFVHLHTNYNNGEKINQFGIRLSYKNKILSPICDKDIFKNLESENPVLLLSLIDSSFYQIDANLFKKIDLFIFKFLIENQLDFKHHRNYELRNKPLDTFWINRKVILSLIKMLKQSFDINSNVTLANFLEKESNFFRMIVDSSKKYILYNKIDRNKYKVNLMMKQSTNKWTSVNEISVSSDGKLIWSDPSIIFWKNKQNLEVVSFVENSLAESYFHYYVQGIRDFKYIDDSNKIRDIFEFIPKTVISLNFDKHDNIIKHQIRYFYPGKPPFNVLSTDDNVKTNKKRLWIYEKAIINSLCHFHFESKSWHIKFKKIFSLKMKEFKQIISNYDSFVQTPIVQYKIENNLTNEYKFQFNFKKISIKDDKLIIECDYSKFSIDQIKKISSYYNKGCEIYIDDDFYIDLTSKDNKKFLEFWSKFDYYNASSPKSGIFVFPKYRVFDLYFAFSQNQGLIKKYGDKSIVNLISDFTSKKVKDFKVPDIFKKILRPYQVDGFKWMKLLFHYNLGGVLADDMGLGKTIQTIALLYDEYKSKKINEPSLIVVPTSLVHNWKSEFIKFANDLKVQLIEGSSKERENLIINNKNAIEITSFATFRKDIKFHNSKSYCFFILDEAQNIKNNNTDLKSCVKQINSKHNLALTGTPIVNNILELWSIFDFVLPGLLGSATDFSNDYEKKIIRENNSVLLERLKQKVNIFCLRRTKDKVLTELPPKTQTDIIVDLQPEHRNFYNDWYLNFKNKIINLIENSKSKQNLNSIKFHIFTMINDLRQICCSPTLKNKNFDGKNAKLDACLDLINHAVASEKKVLIFTQYLGMIDILKDELSKNNIKCYVLSGKTNKKDRISMVEKFNVDKTPVFLSTLKTGGVGINLTSAEVVIHYDLWWNTAMQNQATDRVHRIGQKKHVNVYRIIVDDSIEQRIVEIQEKKKDLIKNLINDDEENILNNISFEELISIFDISYNEKK
ncbi:DEAD/DEAH box helicase [Mycoplasmoides alvi]|uniref:DEAD/DEAH box helicase n=1 Tax=Mycoplasmoides alvi TaxID=78580 RepID=UPI000697D3D7|nr:DEAD/DEAH box helicase [Mycoplasmoides alvi]